MAQPAAWGPVLPWQRQIDPEQGPAPRPKRRTFPAESELRIVAEYDLAPNGEKGAPCAASGCTTRTPSG